MLNKKAYTENEIKKMRDREFNIVDYVLDPPNKKQEELEEIYWSILPNIYQANLIFPRAPLVRKNDNTNVIGVYASEGGFCVRYRTPSKGKKKWRDILIGEYEDFTEAVIARYKAELKYKYRKIKESTTLPHLKDVGYL